MVELTPGKMKKQLTRRWIRQRDGHSCVPVAILNILKWAGIRVTYRKDFAYWNDKARCTRDGAHVRDYSILLSQIPAVIATRKTRPTLGEIDDVLSEGNVVLLRSAWEAGGEIHRHLLLITNRTEKSFFMTNTFRGHAWFAKGLVKKWYLEEHHLRSGKYPTAWFVKRNPAARVANA